MPPVRCPIGATSHAHACFALPPCAATSAIESESHLTDDEFKDALRPLAELHELLQDGLDVCGRHFECVPPVRPYHPPYMLAFG